MTLGCREEEKISLMPNHDARPSANALRQQQLRGSLNFRARSVVPGCTINARTLGG
jgi:hypothetical protein